MKIYKDKPKRVYLKSQIYFVTSKTFNNQPLFKNKEKVIIDSLQFLKGRGDLKLYAYVIIPDHLHLLLEPIKKNISEVMHDLKSYSANEISDFFIGEASPPRLRQGAEALPIDKNTTFKIWQTSFYYHLILSEKDFNHYNYIHYNPVKHGLVNKPEDYKYSSFKLLNKL